MPPSPFLPAILRSSTAKNERRRVLEPGLLELRPALHVERAVVVRDGRAAGEHGGEGLLGVRIVLGGEQQLAAAELGLVAEAVERVVLDQPVERLQRRVQVAALLVGAGQLVEHAVVAGVVRVGLEEVVVAGDRRLVVGRLAAGGALVVGQVHLEVADPAHRLGALRRPRRDLEELAVGVDRLRLGGHDRAIALHRHLAAGERLQRRLVVGRALLAAAEHRARRQRRRRGEQQRRAHAARGLRAWRPHARAPWWRRRGRRAGRPRTAPGSCSRRAAPAGG